MKLAIGCDPNAQDLKEVVIAHIESLGHEVADLGSEDPIYANVAVDVATRVAAGEFERGIVICGTGIGVSIAANKVRGAYCALTTDTYQAKRAQLSNNANMIAFGSQVTGVEVAKEIVTAYLESTYVDTERSSAKVAALHGIED